MSNCPGRTLDQSRLNQFDRRNTPVQNSKISLILINSSKQSCITRSFSLNELLDIIEESQLLQAVFLNPGVGKSVPENICLSKAVHSHKLRGRHSQSHNLTCFLTLSLRVQMTTRSSKPFRGCYAAILPHLGENNDWKSLNSLEP